VGELLLANGFLGEVRFQELSPETLLIDEIRWVGENWYKDVHMLNLRLKQLQVDYWAICCSELRVAEMVLRPISEISI
jgi:hypothetical protein